MVKSIDISTEWTISQLLRFMFMETWLSHGRYLYYSVVEKIRTQIMYLASSQLCKRHLNLQANSVAFFIKEKLEGKTIKWQQ